MDTKLTKIFTYENNPLYGSQLEVGNKRSVGLECSKRLSHRSNIRTLPNKNAYSSHIQSRAVRTDP